MIPGDGTVQSLHFGSVLNVSYTHILLIQEPIMQYKHWLV